jgi:hypothetical protein
MSDSESNKSVKSDKKMKSSKKCGDIYPDMEIIEKLRKQKRRNSFDLSMLKSKQSKVKKMKQNMVKLIETINQEMGMNITEKDSDEEGSLDTIKKLQ